MGFADVGGSDEGVATGSVVASGYGGVGISFYVCATVTSFTQVQFTIQGSWPGCDLELQIKTWDQSLSTATPPGGGDLSITSCYGFPVAKKVATASSSATDILLPLGNFSNWSAGNAGQVVGMQWQWTGANVDPDAAAGCPIDATFTSIKFLP